jgi:ABC-type phosphate transport system permease subunit
MTCRDAVPNEVRMDAVPREARDASLTLGRTKEGLIGRTKKDARQDKVGGTVRKQLL